MDLTVCAAHTATAKCIFNRLASPDVFEIISPFSKILVSTPAYLALPVCFLSLFIWRQTQLLLMMDATQNLKKRHNCTFNTELRPGLPSNKKHFFQHLLSLEI